MRKLAVAMALASTALLTTPALARDNSWYAGVDGGGMIVENTNFNIGAIGTAAQTHDRYGYDVDGVIGYDFGAFRVESEVAYKRANVETYQSSLTTPARVAGGGLVNVGPGNYGYAGGRQSALSFMVNGMLDFGDDNGIQGFVGGGAGVARVKDRIALNTFGSFIHDSDTRFAYQGIAGVRAPLGDHLDVSLKYRFFTAPKLRMFDVTGREFDSRFRSHSLMGGLTYNFGSPPAPPPPPPPPVEAAPPPPPPPPPPAMVCAPGPFIVFFDWDKSDITPEASSILDNAVTQYMSCGNAQVMLAGHADRSGSASYNVGLSQRRADSVKAYLSAHTIPEGVITTQAFGESRPRVETADGVREVQNRRVEVTYGPGSGN